MLDKYESISNQFKNGEKKFSSELRKMFDAVDEIREHADLTLNDITNVNVIISDIDKQFSEKTGITNCKDMVFLWGAVGIQCVRWLLIPTLDEETLTPTTEDRKDSKSEGEKDKTATSKELNKTKDEREGQEFPDEKSIMMLPVPYDAMKGTKDIVIPGVTEYGKNIYSMNHHSATLGHDPIIGQVIGSANIMTRSITFHDTVMTTRKVINPSGRQQEVVKKPYYNKKMMVEDAIKSYNEEHGRLKTALIKENLHLQSDKYTRTGLPIPLLTPALQQKLLMMNWNSKELGDVLKGAGKGIALNLSISALINSAVGTLHGFCYDENKDDTIEIYGVRTKKVIATSNVIAESLNIGTIAAGSIVGALTENTQLIKRAISHFDIGGIITAIHQVASSKKLQEEIRREFLEQELYNHFTSQKYSFLEDTRYEQKERF